MASAALLLLTLSVAGLQSVAAATIDQDVSALRGLMESMANLPPGWGRSTDPCGPQPWEGISCNGSRVTNLKLFNMGLRGSLRADVGMLTALRILDLSYNKDLGGALTPAIENLLNLEALIMVGCSFSGFIPGEIGKLSKLTFLALNSNQFHGNIPASLGRLSKLTYLDLADNRLTGVLPVSNGSSPGLDQLLSTKHFHFNKNSLSGPIPEKLFHPDMQLIHLLLDRNQIDGSIPSSMGTVKALQIIRLDRNLLNGPVPANINNLTGLHVLNLANNGLTGAMPDLSGMKALNMVDLSNNSFDPSEAPAWISENENLTALVIESGGLHGPVPQNLFSFPLLQKVKLKNNLFNGTLDMGNNISQQLQVVDLENNDLTSAALGSSYNNSILLSGNPVCSNIHLSGSSYCLLPQRSPPASIPGLGNCEGKPCPTNTTCLHPYTGLMFFRAPSFDDLSKEATFQLLQRSIWDKYGPNLGSVSLQNPFFDNDSYLEVQLLLCPLTAAYFDKEDILVNLDLSSKNYSAPFLFGPSYFWAFPYDLAGSSKLNKGMILGLMAACTFLLLVLVSAGFYAFKQKRRAKKAIELSNPFGILIHFQVFSLHCLFSFFLALEKKLPICAILRRVSATWEASFGGSGGDAPRLKGTKFFSMEELKKYTNNFPEINVIGSGGYGKVYRGILPGGRLAAIKRSKAGSSQGGVEFKTEIELLSRVHHRNLVDLIGFCFQQGEQILVYEYVPNGSLRESLCGKSGIQLDWNRRLKIALDSARGLAYLHEFADPPIIHRDIKSANILLDEDLNAKVADFGLSKLVSDDEEDHVSRSGVLLDADPDGEERRVQLRRGDAGDGDRRAAPERREIHRVRGEVGAGQERRLLRVERNDGSRPRGGGASGGIQEIRGARAALRGVVRGGPPDDGRRREGDRGLAEEGRPSRRAAVRVQKRRHSRFV